MRDIITSILFFLLPILSVHGQIGWQEYSQIASADFGNNHPRIAMNGQGQALVIWGNSGKLMFSKLEEEEFTTPESLNPDGVSVAEASWMGPAIASHGDTVYIVFKEAPEISNDSHIWCIRSENGGDSFSKVVRVDTIGSDLSRFPTVSTDDVGNPIVGFMRFDPGFKNARWVVTKSLDQGQSFQPDTVASGWSDPSTVACDCCPGTVQSSGPYVAMIYRDNNDNVRDNWAGISNTGGASFQFGLPIDQHNWNYPACPSSGPDGFILGDTLYSVFMNGASGKNRVYINATDLETLSASQGMALTQDHPGLIRQNYVRIAHDGKTAAMAWTQIENGNGLIPLLLARDISNRSQMLLDTVTLEDIENVDLALIGEKIFVVWQNTRNGTVNYRIGLIERANYSKQSIHKQWSVYPNPSLKRWTVNTGKQSTPISLYLFNTMGEILYSRTLQAGESLQPVEISNAHLEVGAYILIMETEIGKQAKILIKK